MVTIGGLVKGVTHLAVQSFNDPWARRLRFVSFLAGSIALTQIWLLILTAGRTFHGGLLLVAAILWGIAYPLMWLRIFLVFMWTPMANRHRKARAHAVRVARTEEAQVGAGRPPPQLPP